MHVTRLLRRMIVESAVFHKSGSVANPDVREWGAVVTTVATHSVPGLELSIAEKSSRFSAPGRRHQRVGGSLCGFLASCIAND